MDKTFPLHHEKKNNPTTEQKHSHATDNERVRLRGNTDFSWVITKKIFPFLFPQALQSV